MRNMKPTKQSAEMVWRYGMNDDGKITEIRVALVTTRNRKNKKKKTREPIYPWEAHRRMESIMQDRGLEVGGGGGYGRINYCGTPR
jgi:hypothetical protein